MRRWLSHKFLETATRCSSFVIPYTILHCSKRFYKYYSSWFLVRFIGKKIFDKNIEQRCLKRYFHVMKILLSISHLRVHWEVVKFTAPQISFLLYLPTRLISAIILHGDKDPAMIYTLRKMNLDWTPHSSYKALKIFALPSSYYFAALVVCCVR